MSTWRRAIPRSLAGQFLLLQLGVMALVLLVVAVLSVRQSVRAFADEGADRMLGAAENVSGQPVVWSNMNASDPLILVPAVEAARSLSGASYVTIADPDRTIIASTDPTLVGTTLQLPEQSAWEGRAWSGEMQTDAGQAIAASVPILDLEPSNGESPALLGIAVVAQEYPSTWELLVEAIPELFFLLGLAALLGLGGSWLLARVIKRQTHGLEPAQIASLADHREALLHSIREGVLGVGADGRVTVANDGARVLLDLPEDCVGTPIDELGLTPAVLDVLQGRHTGRDVVAIHGQRVLVLNRRTARSDGRTLGTVTTLRDRSDLIAVQRELGATRNATQTLRAQTHEFANQLHTIGGLIQLGHHDEAGEFIATLTKRRARLDAHVAALIEDPAVAALLIAKASLAAESATTFRLSDRSRLGPLPTELSTDATTVVGNLVDNALDAVSGAVHAVVEVEITQEDNEVRIVVTDTGPGVPSGADGNVFERGFSTKPTTTIGGRGIGLSLVRLVCERRGGSVRVHNADGAVFTAVLPVSAVVPA